MSISTTSTAQPQSMGPLRLTIGVCASNPPSCPEAANGGSLYRGLLDLPNPSERVTVQPLVAVRLPDGATPPDSVLAAVNGGGTLAFTRSPSYEAELEHFEPAPPGERWWGWISAAAWYSTSSPQSFTFTIEVPLPRPADGGALPSPLHWRPVTGGRMVYNDNGLTASRPVDCGTTVTHFYQGYTETGSSPNTVSCVSSTSAEATRGHLDAPLIDFGLTGTTAQASAGSTTTATFIARRSGLPDPATTFALAAAGGPDAGQPGGTAPLTLTASLAPRRFRAGARRVAARRGRPAVGTLVTVTSSHAARLTWTVERKQAGRRAGGRCRPQARRGARCTTWTRVGRAATRQLAAGRTRFAFSGTVARRALRPGAHRLVLVATDAAGLRATRTVPFTILRP